MTDKKVTPLSTMTGSGVFHTTADGKKYNVRGLKIKWQEEYEEDKLFVSIDDKKPKGFGQYWNVSDKEKRGLIFKWFNRLVFNQITGEPMNQAEFIELEYDDIEAMLLKIMRLSD